MERRRSFYLDPLDRNLACRGIALLRKREGHWDEGGRGRGKIEGPTVAIVRDVWPLLWVLHHGCSTIANDRQSFFHR